MNDRAHLDDGTRVSHNTISTCKLAKVTYDMDMAIENQNTVSRDFALDVCQLPLAMNGSSVSDYMTFLDNWGTVRI